MTLGQAPARPRGAEQESMRAVVYDGLRKVRVAERARPRVVAPDEAVVRVTTAAVCGSDLHLYRYVLPPGPFRDFVLGHEYVGVVEDVGPDVAGVSPGDRVVGSGLLACGFCWFCRNELFSQCDTTNPSGMQEMLWGDHKAALLGLSPLLGDHDGAQADAVRVPFADVNLLALPDDVPDEKAVFLSDVLTVAWMGNDLGETGPGDTVAVWGCGPVGLLALHCARARGAERLVAVDHHAYRLDVAKRLGADVVDFGKESVVERMRELTGGRGPDVAIEAVGFRNASSLHHRVQYALKLETDALDTVTQAVRAVRKGGTVSIIGAYLGYGNQFPIGAVMEKGLTVRSAPVHVQRYWRELLGMLREGTLDPSFAATHTIPLDRAPEGYRLMDERRDGALKVLLTP